jgi:YD repeat-containing protein
MFTLCSPKEADGARFEYDWNGLGRRLRRERRWSASCGNHRHSMHRRHRDPHAEWWLIYELFFGSIIATELGLSETQFAILIISA